MTNQRGRLNPIEGMAEPGRRRCHEIRRSIQAEDIQRTEATEQGESSSKDSQAELLHLRAPGQPQIPTKRFKSRGTKGRVTRGGTNLKPSWQISIQSATFPLPVATSMRKHGKDPYKSNLRDEPTLKGRTQYYEIVQKGQRQGEGRAKKSTERGSSCYYGHAKRSQDHRIRTLDEVRTGLCRNLVGSDSGTRGINSPDKSLHILAPDQPHTKGL